MKITSGKQILFFKNDTILRFEAMAGQTLIHFSDGKTLKVDASIETINNQLKDSGFIRIHSQHIINVNCIARITNGTADFVELSSGAVLPINGKQKEIIINLISDHLDKLKS